MANKNIIKLYITTFLINFTLFTPIVTLFFKSRGLDYSQILFMIAWFMVWVFIFEIPSGALADFFKRKSILSLSAVLYLIATVLIFFSYSYNSFLIAQIIWAGAVSLFSGTNYALIYDSLKEQSQESLSKKIFANVKIVTTLSVILASIFGGFLAEINIGYPQLFYAVPAIFCFFIYFSIKEPKIKQYEKITFNSYCTKIRKSFSTSLKHKVLFSIILNASIIAALFGVIIWLWQPLLRDYGLELKYFGLLFALAGLVSIPVLKNLEKIERKLKTKNVFILSTLVPGVLLILISITNLLSLAIVYICLIFIFMSVREPLFSHYLNLYTKSEERATTLSIKSFFHRAAHIIILPFFGFFADKISLDTSFLVIGILMIIASAIFKIES